MLLDRQYYNPNDPRPYDDVGWTVGPLFDTRTVRVEDPAFLESRMAPVTEPVREAGGVTGSGSAYVVAYDADNELASFRYANPGLRIEAAEAPFDLGGTTYPAGSWIIPETGNAPELRRTLELAGAEYGFTAVATGQTPTVATHPVATPRVAVVHDWRSTQNEGWLRVGLDEYGIPYDYVSVHAIRDTPDLKDRWDVILMGPTGNAMSVLTGLEGDEPILWAPTEHTPNIGRQDATADMRGGVELQGILNLERFLEAGGVLVTLTSSSDLPVHFGLARGVAIVERPGLWAERGVFRVEKLEPAHPLGYGFGDELGVSFGDGPIFATGGGGGRGGSGAGEELGGPGSTTARRTGRGAPDDRDIVQGRPRDWGQEGVEEFMASEEDDEEDGEDGAVPAVRTVFAFARDPMEVLISGGVRNPDLLAGAPALVDVRRGQGHVVLFSFNPFWRSHTHGSYALVFNALLNYGSYVPATAVISEVPEDGTR
jgi:hypothetical protein